jgi:predicted transcriptional regulator
VCGRSPQQVHDQVLELERDGVVVLVDGGRSEDAPVGLLRLLRVVENSVIGSSRTA